MIVYGVASGGIAYLIGPIFDVVLPTGEQLGFVATAILGLYLFKGIGAYLSSYLMTDVGQRVVQDLRNVLFRHILRQSAAFFSSQTTGRLLSRITNDVAQIQNARVGDARRRDARVAVDSLLRRRARVYRRAAGVVCFTGAPLVVYPLVRLGQSVRRTTRRSQEALEHMTHVSAEAFSGHRIVKAFGAEEREATSSSARPAILYRTNMRVTSA
jgi:subfamily B ATP-binding cassette protein MsbA